MRKTFGLVIALVGMLLVPKPAAAFHLLGELDFDGSVRITFEGLIDWILPIGGGNGIAIIQPTSTGIWNSFAGTTVTELDLNGAVLFPGGLPPGGSGALNLPNFETLAAAPGTNFTATGINACTAPLCAAGPTSPFNFVTLPNGTGGFNTTVILSLFGTMTSPLDPGVNYTWSGTWSADLPGQTAAQVIAQLSGPGTFIDAPYSAAKITALVPVTVIPEPATLLTFGLGSTLLAAYRRRRRAKKS